MRRAIANRVRCAGVVGCLSLAIARAASPYDEAFDAIMARYQLPGLAVGVIEDGNVTYLRTAGELVAGSGQPATPDALFKIASNSKAMTTAMLARLVAAGKLDWNAPVTRYLPTFRMYDSWVTRNMQIGDLLMIKCTGAYGASMASTYNSRPLAAEVLLDNGRFAVIRRRQSADELIVGEAAVSFWETPA